MFGEKLRYLREHQEYTQRDAAKKLGIGQTTYNRYEQGIYEPDYKTLKKIANFFCVSIDYLLDNDDGFVSDMDAVVDLNRFLLHGNYTILARFPTEKDRRMLDGIVKAIYAPPPKPPREGKDAGSALPKATGAEYGATARPKA